MSIRNQYISATSFDALSDITTISWVAHIYWKVRAWESPNFQTSLTYRLISSLQDSDHLCSASHLSIRNKNTKVEYGLVIDENLFVEALALCASRIDSSSYIMDKVITNILFF